MTVAANADGRLHAFLVDLDGQLEHNEQLETKLGAGWTGWQPLGEQGDLALGYNSAVAANADGRLHAFLAGIDGQLWHNEQLETKLGAAWTGWQPLGEQGDRGKSLAVAANADGRLHAFLEGARGQLQHNEQLETKLGAAWTGWQPLTHEGDRGVDVPVATAQDGTLIAFSQLSAAQLPAADSVLIQYDALGRPWRRSQPFRGLGQPVSFTETTYDALGRVTAVTQPDGSQAQIYYDEARRPRDAYPGKVPGRTERYVDAWGRERWLLRDALARIVEVVEPLPNRADGSVFTEVPYSNQLKNKPQDFLPLPSVRYSYDALDRIVEISQSSLPVLLTPNNPAPPAVRRFRYDGLGRLTHQKLAERNATLNDSGVHVGVLPSATGRWSDVFQYDERSTARRTQRRARRPPPARLRRRPARTAPPHQLRARRRTQPDAIEPVDDITYDYMEHGDRNRVKYVHGPHGFEFHDYDTEGRLRLRRLRLADQPDYDIDTEFFYDELDRLNYLAYPPRYPEAGAGQLGIAPRYDIAGRLETLRANDIELAGGISYDPGGLPLGITLTGAGGPALRETYTYDPQTAALNSQELRRGDELLLALDYSYTRPAQGPATTGQLVQTTDRLDPRKSRTYTYDATTRLRSAAGGDPARPALDPDIHVRPPRQPDRRLRGRDGRRRQPYPSGRQLRRLVRQPNRPHRIPDRLRLRRRWQPHAPHARMDLAALPLRRSGTAGRGHRRHRRRDRTLRLHGLSPPPPHHHSWHRHTHRPRMGGRHGHQ